MSETSRSAALLVIDVQRVCMGPGLFVTRDGDDPVVKCLMLIGSARVAGVAVIFVRHFDKVPPSDPALAKICPNLAPRESEPVIEKRFPSAFMRTDLEDAFRQRSAETLYDCGLATYG